MMARYTANTDVAKAITRIFSHAPPAFSVGSDVVTEMVLQSKAAPNTFEKFELDDQVGTREVGLGEVAFDIVVPEEGMTYAEGCYRINGGNPRHLLPQGRREESVSRTRTRIPTALPACRRIACRRI
jgi:hypothetical protein